MRGVACRENCSNHNTGVGGYNCRDIPAASKMYIGEEGKIKAILPYALKREIKIRRAKK